MSLKSYFFHLIKTDGPIPFDQYMRVVNRYYYSTSAPIGKSGDFITAPEISQIFGEIIGIWCIDQFNTTILSDFYLIELGAGNGTMMVDILRTTSKYAKFSHHLKKIIIVENSDLLRQKQMLALTNYIHKIEWIADINELPQHTNLMLIANEFIDALPVKQFIKTNDKFYEIYVGLKNDYLCYQLVDNNKIDHSDYTDCPEDGVIETNETILKILESLNNLTSNSKFCGLFIDYGYTTNHYTPTVQAVKNHGYTDILLSPGSSDLTAHVDFLALSNFLTQKDISSKILDQGTFLNIYGASARANQLALNNNGYLQSIPKDLERLTSDQYMGKMFKVLEAIK